MRLVECLNLTKQLVEVRLRRDHFALTIREVRQCRSCRPVREAARDISTARSNLGDQPDEGLRARNDVGAERWKDGEFLSPHCARWDSRGDLYVVDWNFLGRVTKLERVRQR